MSRSTSTSTSQAGAGAGAGVLAGWLANWRSQMMVHRGAACLVYSTNVTATIGGFPALPCPVSSSLPLFLSFSDYSMPFQCGTSKTTT
eukprot:767949-Hanusia_phi.AAC.7